MKKILALCSVFALAATLTGCYSAPVIPPVGYGYANYSAPLDIDYDDTSVSSKSGYATSESILGLVAWGDCSAATAARNGGISTIEHADYEFFNVLGVYQKFTTVVRGN